MYPPPPWSLRGWGCATVHLVDARRARPFIPPGWTIVCVAPQRTIGGLVFASYEAGSTLQYHELVVVAALVRRGTQFAFALPRLYVDDERSLAGGREIWNVNKAPAAFDITRDGTQCTIRVTGARSRIDLTVRGRIPLPMPPLPVAALGDVDGTGRLMFARLATSAIAGMPALRVRGDDEASALDLQRPLAGALLGNLSLDVAAPRPM